MAQTEEEFRAALAAAVAKFHESHRVGAEFIRKDAGGFVISLTCATGSGQFHMNELGVDTPADSDPLTPTEIAGVILDMVERARA